jgi:hypothetical protein
MLLLNYAHPLTDAQLTQIHALQGMSPEVRDIDVQIDRSRPLAEVAKELADAANLSPVEWQTLALAINPPGLAPLALALIAEIHGRSGYFPQLLNIRPSSWPGASGYEVAEIVDLRDVRDQARGRRRHNP